jgi:hypothetical protein
LKARGAKFSLAFAEKGLKLAPDTGNLTLWVYNTQENDKPHSGPKSWTPRGKKHQVEFAN